jgi:hypothetical protein
MRYVIRVLRQQQQKIVCEYCQAETEISVVCLWTLHLSNGIGKKRNPIPGFSKTPVI